MKVPRVLAKYVDVVNHPGVYIKAEIDKVKHNVQVEVSNAMGKIIVFAMLGLFGLFLLTFASITLALFLNSVLDSSFYGFLIVTGLYLLLVIFLVAIRNNDSLQRSMFGLPEKKQPVMAEKSSLPPPDKVDPRKFGVAKPTASGVHPQDREITKRTVVRPDTPGTRPTTVKKTIIRPDGTTTEYSTSDGAGSANPESARTAPPPPPPDTRPEPRATSV